MYDIHSRTRNFCKICKTVPQYPGYGYNISVPARKTPVSSVRPCHNTWNFRKFSKIFMPVPEISEFCRTFIPVPGTSVSSVRPVPQYPGYGYSFFCTRPELLWVMCNTSIPVPETSGSSVKHLHPYPESTNPTEHNHDVIHALMTYYASQDPRQQRRKGRYARNIAASCGYVCTYGQRSSEEWPIVEPWITCLVEFTKPQRVADNKIENTSSYFQKPCKSGKHQYYSIFSFYGKDDEDRTNGLTVHTAISHPVSSTPLLWGNTLI